MIQHHTDQYLYCQLSKLLEKLLLKELKSITIGQIYRIIDDIDKLLVEKKVYSPVFLGVAQTVDTP